MIIIGVIVVCGPEDGAHYPFPPTRLFGVGASLRRRLSGSKGGRKMMRAVAKQHASLIYLRGRWPALPGGR
jgi:hypothetical protein